MDHDASSGNELLGQAKVSATSFSNLEKTFQSLSNTEYTNLLEKQNAISETLYHLILKEPKEAFLLPAVVEYIDEVVKQKLLDSYSFSQFEFWLNREAKLSNDKQLEVRGKIVGKYIPRNHYQVAFPIGSGKTYEGTHFITAHGSPDVDTIVATFWGWIDAFAAKVSSGCHIWNVPEGPPSSQVEIDLLFYQIFGQRVFDRLARFRTALTLTSMDLISQKSFLIKNPHELSFDIDHERDKGAVVVVDKNGYFLGDWRHIDIEGVRQVVNSFNICLRWIESDLHVSLISLFTQPSPTKKQAQEAIDAILKKRLVETDPAKEFTLRQQQQLQLFLEQVLDIKDGLNASFSDFLHSLEGQGIVDAKVFLQALEQICAEDLFNAQGDLIEDRPLLFSRLQKVFIRLSHAFLTMRYHIDTLDVSMKIKQKVFERKPSFLSYRADIEEVKGKIGSYPYLTVNYSDADGGHIPIGVVFASDLFQEKLGTVTLRDFCNRDETKVPPYLEVISVIDHHKASLQTSAPPLAMIADAQSSNVLVAQLAFKMHDTYSTGGMDEKSIDAQIARLQSEALTPSNSRVLKRLLQRKLACHATGEYYISPEREFIEYKHYLYAIFDDTDLLTKATYVDVHVVKELANRLKSLQQKKEVEIVHFDEIPQGDGFAKSAATCLLQNKDLYSLYSKVYLARELTIQEQLDKCVQGHKSSIFSDTKTQNECARVGQTKIFGNNIEQFIQLSSQLREIWLTNSKKFHKERPHVDVYIHMVSTIAGAEDLYKGKQAEYTHKDELWFWIPERDSAIEHLKLFLSAFQKSPAIVDNNLELELFGKNAKELMQIFKESFLDIPISITDEDLPIAVLRYKAGTLNSRKSQISPYLPKIRG